MAEATEDERQPDAARDEPEPQEKTAEDLIGQQVVDPHGVTIGKIEALFIHSHDERATWARVKMDLGMNSAFLPLHDAQDEGGRIRVVYEKERVKVAPEIEPDGDELNEEEADQLRGHYGLERVTGLAIEGADDIELSREARDADPPTMKDRPWAVEKYPLPDMDRPEGQSSERQESQDRAESAER